MIIVERITLAGEELFKANGYEFQRGFNTCKELFDIGLKKQDQHNKEQLLRDLAVKDNEISDLKYKLQKCAEHKDKITKRYQDLQACRKLPEANIRLTVLRRFIKSHKLKSTLRRFIQKTYPNTPEKNYE